MILMLGEVYLYLKSNIAKREDNVCRLVTWCDILMTIINHGGRQRQEIRDNLMFKHQLKTLLTAFIIFNLDYLLLKA